MLAEDLKALPERDFFKGIGARLVREDKDYDSVVHIRRGTSKKPALGRVHFRLGQL